LKKFQCDKIFYLTFNGITERSIQSHVQEALIENVSSILMGNAPGVNPGKRKTINIEMKLGINSYHYFY